MDDKELIRSYAERFEDIRDLYTRHQELEKELKQLAKRPYLTPEEELREKQIKLEKLHIKERIFELIRKYQKEGSGIG